MFLGIGLVQIFMLLAGTISSLAWIFLYIRYNKEFNNLIQPIGKNEFFLSDIFFIGFGIMKILNYNLGSSKARNKIKKIAEIKKDVYAEYYHYIITGGKLTYITTFLPVAFFISALSNDIFIFFIALMSIGTLVYYLDFEIENDVVKKRDELVNDFPRALSKLALLLGAGITLREAWKSVSESKNGKLYQEMRLVSEEISNGVSEAAAYRKFSEKCNIKQIRKFSSILIQNLQKGNREIAVLIKEIAEDSWQQKKYDVKIKAELASSKLMLPVGIMLAAIMVMIVVPIFSSL